MAAAREMPMLVRFRSPERDRESDAKRRTRLRDVVQKSRDLAAEDAAGAPQDHDPDRQSEIALYDRLLQKLDAV